MITNLSEMNEFVKLQFTFSSFEYGTSILFNQQEKGDLKLRVRALESERAFQRVATVQKTLGNVSFSVGSHACLVACLHVNIF